MAAPAEDHWAKNQNLALGDWMASSDQAGEMGFGLDASGTTSNLLGLGFFTQAPWEMQDVPIGGWQYEGDNFS